MNVCLHVLQINHYFASYKIGQSNCIPVFAGCRICRKIDRLRTVYLKATRCDPDITVFINLHTV